MYDGEGKGTIEIIDEKGGNRVLYALFEITEGALTFVERGRIGMLKQGQDMGVFSFK